MSGPVASGKTAVSAALQECYGFAPISSGAFLREQLASQNKALNRYALQELGDTLDCVTDFSWLVESVADPIMSADANTRYWLVDAVRKARQVELFKHRYGGSVRHVHLCAPDPVLRQRHLDQGRDLADYQAILEHPNEQSARSLAGLADKVFDTQELTPLAIAGEIVTLWEA
nr:hypothetical protein [Pseudomonas sp. 21LCFQ010]